MSNYSNVPELKTSSDRLSQGLGQLTSIVTTRPDLLQIGGRDFAFSLAHLYIGGLLLEHAAATGDPLDAVTVYQYTIRDLVPIYTIAKQDGYALSQSKMSEFVFEGYQESLL